ncbi:MAG: DUF1116 domain-containing protein [Deltaproteobacteria bacterium]|nr:DUF1116 domain-containing protein [Deltaproteobacteria bacterium]
MTRAAELFGQPLAVLNLGLTSFADTLRQCGTRVVQVDWRPAAGGDREAMAALDALVGADGKARPEIANANQEAIRRLGAAKPVLEGIGVALEDIPGMRSDLVLHSGPPVPWELMSGPTRGAIMGALVYEGLAKSPEDAARLAQSGAVELAPCHHHQTVGPMAGVVTASMPVLKVRNVAFGNLAFATLNEGLGKVLRYGAYDDTVLERLRWMQRSLAPALGAALQAHGPLDLQALIAQALQMGDEGHNRNRAATSLVIRALAPHLVEGKTAPAEVGRVLRFLDANDHFFLNLSMAAAKAALDPTLGIPHSTLISAMARNGTEFGLRVSGLGERWFCAPAPMVDGLYLPGFSAADAAPDIGDSVITETYGIGGFAMAAAPAIVQFVGGRAADALRYTERMYAITMAEHAAYKIPALDFRGSPMGIDLLKVVDTGIVPVVNTGIAHKTPGIGMVGAGLVKPPLQCFVQALVAFAAEEQRGRR